MNEPQVLTLLGYAAGVHAPGQELGFGALPVAHHLLLGHGLAARALKAAGAREVGIVEKPHAGLAGHRLGRRQGRRRRLPPAVQLAVRRPGAAGPVPGGRAGRRDARPGRRRPEGHLHPAGLLRPQLLHAGPGRGQGKLHIGRSAGGQRAGAAGGAAVRAARDRGRAGDRLRLAGGAGRAAADPAGVSPSGTAARCPRSTSPRTAAPTTTVRMGRAGSRTGPGSTTTTGTCARCARRWTPAWTCAATSPGP